ncbi:conserved hypothetical protein [Methylobacterium sp. 4-46]|uniref:hypothetical protein n=1 Tax=unclassified Methylobacterium TaxID=2615210 RepID=UPI000152CD96|nr:MULTISPECIES: hypothetical protein [Methylobacterium]ACA20224.1 conserved hypothetical protein [Methylobacterium sp. 4-46]WFT79402.1 hypothetical protein QA634_30010 [Methylobacterium nodulans]
MLFGLHIHHPAHLSIWIAPDDQRVVPRIKVTVDGVTTVSSANEVDHNLKSWGWHSTGLCAFNLHDGAFPGLSEAALLEVRDYDTNILLYRRSRELGDTQRRVLFLDHTIGQASPLRDTLFSKFQISHLMLKGVSQPVLNCIIGNQFLNSLFCYGPIFYPVCESFLIEHKFLKIFLAHDPYLELARRIFWLRRVSELAVSSARHWQIEEIVDACYFASSLDFSDLPLLKKSFRNLDAKTTNTLSNPMTRYLGARDEREALNPGHWSTAIQNLSRFEVVGHHDYAGEFSASVMQALDLPYEEPVPRPGPRQEVRDAAEMLRAVRNAAPLVEMDLDLSERIRSLVEKYWKQA